MRCMCRSISLLFALCVMLTAGCSHSKRPKEESKLQSYNWVNAIDDVWMNNARCFTGQSDDGKFATKLYYVGTKQEEKCDGKTITVFDGQIIIICNALAFLGISANNPAVACTRHCEFSADGFKISSARAVWNLKKRVETLEEAVAKLRTKRKEQSPEHE